MKAGARRDQQSIYDEEQEGREARTRHEHRRRCRRRDRLGTHAVGRGQAGGAEARSGAVAVRCMLRPDGSVPQSEDEPDLVATVAKAY